MKKDRQQQLRDGVKMTNEDFNKNMQKVFFRLERNLKLVRENYIKNWGASQITSFLFALQEVCELMSDDYYEDQND